MLAGLWHSDGPANAGRSIRSGKSNLKRDGSRYWGSQWAVFDLGELRNEAVHERISERSTGACDVDLGKTAIIDLHRRIVAPDPFQTNQTKCSISRVRSGHGVNRYEEQAFIVYSSSFALGFDFPISGRGGDERCCGFTSR
jgi:hypothetical protein